jgi:hypothetical protein
LRLLRLLLYPESPVLHGSPKKKYKIWFFFFLIFSICIFVYQKPWTWIQLIWIHNIAKNFSDIHGTNF